MRDDYQLLKMRGVRMIELFGMVIPDIIMVRAMIRAIQNSKPKECVVPLLTYWKCRTANNNHTTMRIS
jgi:hypothetical protein